MSGQSTEETCESGLAGLLLERGLVNEHDLDYARRVLASCAPAGAAPSAAAWATAAGWRSSSC